MEGKYLTKTLLNLAMECPTKLYYAGKKEYANQKIDDPFILSLENGGFQVGELAKHYFPGGVEVDTLDYNKALRETNELLKRKHVVIYEGAVSVDKFFIRTDILVKDGDSIELIEVKAKSFGDFSDIYNRNGTIKPTWKPYFYEIAFQKHVISKAFPNYNISAHLMLVDKNSKCPTDGLNQKFRIIRDQNTGKKKVLCKDLSEEDLSQFILRKINVENACNLIYAEKFDFEGKTVSFVELIGEYAENYAKDKKIRAKISKNCKECEFRATEEEKKAGLKSGFHECWNEMLGYIDADFEIGTIFDIWDFRNIEKSLAEGRIKLTDLTEDYIGVKPADGPGISRTQRQWLQIQKAVNKDSTYWIDKDNLSREMKKWTYPLHFIDFETCMVAIPFNKGRHPYEGIAFQFSHHVVHEDGDIEHKGQYLNTVPGLFPNYDFIRELKKQLEQDEGTIFRYGTHENTFLIYIYRQLTEDEADIPDREELCRFIKDITKSTDRGLETWEGHRCMVDMFELVKKYYYDPAMKGSNSIKVVLPSILNSSDFLQKKYSQPIYGAAGGIPSLNYKDWVWIKYEGNRVIDPYKLLPKMFEDMSDRDFILLDSNELRNGGAAMTAYALLQFEDLSDYEREEITKALLKYCELDTFAMVMIYEGWKHMI